MNKYLQLTVVSSCIFHLLMTSGWHKGDVENVGVYYIFHTSNAVWQCLLPFFNIPLSGICLLCILSSCGVLTLCIGQFCHYLFISTNSEWSYTNVFVGLCMSFYASLTVLYRGWWIQLVEWAHPCWGGIDWFALWLRVTYLGAYCCSSWRKLQTQHLYNGQCSRKGDNYFC